MRRLMKQAAIPMLASLLMLTLPRAADALSCMAPDGQIVIQPKKDGDSLARDAPILIYRVHGTPAQRLRLIDRTRKRVVKFTIVRHDNINLLVITAQPALVAGRRYELRVGRRVLRRFIVKAKASTKGAPELRGAKVTFGPKSRAAWHGYDYVPGSVKLDLANSTPAAIGFEVRYTPSRAGARASRRMTRFTLPFKPQLAFSRAELCPKWGTGHAPIAGGYDLRITAVGTRGGLSKTLTLKGWVRPAKASSLAPTPSKGR